MQKLILGRDIAFRKAHPESASLTFTVLNPDAVDTFMADADLQTFLTDPFRVGEQASEAGCRLIIIREEGALKIGRQYGTDHQRKMAPHELLSSLKTYVLEGAPAGVWEDMSGGLLVEAQSFEEIALRSSLPRGDALLDRPSAGPIYRTM